MKIYLSGKLVNKRDAKVSVFDHGLLYGDGVFEGIRAYNGRIFLLEDHIARLYRSAKSICLDIGMSQKSMANAVIKTCAANKLKDGYVRLVVTRGTGTLGLNPYLCKKPEVIIIAAEIQLYPRDVYENGMKIVTVGTLRNLSEAVNPRIKSLNYLNNVLAKIEAINAGALECIMLNAQGKVAEASGDNVFVVNGKVLRTPPVSCGALEGITRDFVMQVAAENGFTVREEVLDRYDLYTADEIFLTGTAAEIVGVSEYDRRVIGNGKPGPVTRKLTGLFHDHTRANGTPIFPA